jgi:hypothetical protein
MRYTPSIAAITFLALLLDLVSSLPVQPNDLHVRNSRLQDHTLDTRSPIAALEGRSLVERQAYSFGTPTEHAGLGTAVERPNPCGAGCTTKKLKPRELSGEELRMRHALRKRTAENGEFITNVEFVPE